MQVNIVSKLCSTYIPNIDTVASTLSNADAGNTSSDYAWAPKRHDILSTSKIGLPYFNLSCAAPVSDFWQPICKHSVTGSRLGQVAGLWEPVEGASSCAPRFSYSAAIHLVSYTQSSMLQSRARSWLQY